MTILIPKKTPAMQMIKTLHTICFIFPLLLSFNASGQIWPSDEYIYQEAGKYVLSEEYTEALTLYQDLIDKGYDNINIHYRIGQCYIHMPGQKYKARPYLEKAAAHASADYREDKLNQDISPLKSLLYLGVAWRLEHKFDKSLEAFNILKDSLDVLSGFETIVDFHISRVENAIGMLESSLELEVQKLNENINDRFSNYNPVTDMEDSVLYYMNEYQFYDAVMMAVRQEDRWTAPDNLTPVIKSDGDYYLTGISPDGSTLLLSFYDIFSSWDIYTTKRTENGWEEMRKLGGTINTRYNERYASFSPDGKAIYFTSNRSGGFGGTDIYLAELNDSGTWGPAINLGPSVNTAYNEIAPFEAYEDDVLFFCSQGHFNMGGYDIFYSQKDDDGRWLPSHNLGYPLSTADDDKWFFPLSLTEGYYSKFEHNANGINRDIYTYSIISFSNPYRFMITVNLSDTDELPFRDTKLNVTDKSDDAAIIDKMPVEDSVFNFRLPSGKFKMTITSPGFDDIEKDISLSERLPENEIVIEARVKAKTIKEKDTFRTESILFTFDSYALQKEYITTLDRVAVLMDKYPDLAVEIAGYTDSMGPAGYNRVLSEKRAREVAGYITQQGIDKERLIIKGYGEDNPVAINSNPDGTDNHRGRKYNRRVDLYFKNDYNSLVIKMICDIPEELKVTD